MSSVAHSPSRRRLLLAGGLLAARPALGAPTATNEPRLQALLAERRSLWLVRGREELKATYWTAQRGFDRDQYLQICWALRDLKAGRVFPMDRRLLDVLAGVQAWLAAQRTDAPLEIRSGYRTRSTNVRLEGAALNSRHLVGRAVDITVPGVSNLRLAGIASVLSRGGTGLYPGRDFVHVDTGDERIWIR